LDCVRILAFFARLLVLVTITLTMAAAKIMKKTAKNTGPALEDLPSRPMLIKSLSRVAEI
jgi:hypothetical protein